MRWVYAMHRPISFITSQSASPTAPLKGSLRTPLPPLEGRWHGASRDGEVAAPHAPTIGTSRSPYRDGVGAAAGGGEVRPLKTLRIGGRGIMH